jgi:tmRNA-binding protein
LRIIPLELYETTTRRVKLKLGLGKLKKKIEKRSVIKDREVTREIDRTMKKYR